MFYVQVLRQVQTIKMDDVVLGQYTRSEDGSKPAYLDDETVPKVKREKKKRCFSFFVQYFFYLLFSVGKQMSNVCCCCVAH